MYTIKFKAGGQDITLLTQDRKNARYTKMCLKENDYEVEVTQEVQPRPVKFKGVD